MIARFWKDLHDPMTTKMKNPSRTGPTGKSFPFFVLVSGTAPRLVIFFSNFCTFLSASLLEVVYIEVEVTDNVINIKILMMQVLQ